MVYRKVVGMNETYKEASEMAHEESIAIADTLFEQGTVSDGDAECITTVSGSDTGSMINIVDMTETNMLLTTILFFMVATWSIERIKSGIRRLVKNE